MDCFVPFCSLGWIEPPIQGLKSHHLDLLRDPNLYLHLSQLKPVGNGREDPNKKTRENLEPNSRSQGTQVRITNHPREMLRDHWIHRIPHCVNVTNHQWKTLLVISQNQGEEGIQVISMITSTCINLEQLTIIAPDLKSKYKLHDSWAATFIEYSTREPWKKNTVAFHCKWFFNRDPYNGVLYIIPTLLSSIIPCIP